MREYPQGLSAAHVVGYIGRIADGDIEDLERAGQLGNYRGTDVIGKKGIEKTWEEALHGRTGLEEVEVTAGGRPMRTLRRIDPVPGSDIMLSIDMGLQKVAEQAFEGSAARWWRWIPIQARCWPSCRSPRSIPISSSTASTWTTGAC